MVRLWDAEIRIYFKGPWSLLSPAFLPVPSPWLILAMQHCLLQDAGVAQPVPRAVISSARLNQIAAETRHNPPGFLGGFSWFTCLKACISSNARLI